jgi:hypothetical protein
LSSRADLREFLLQFSEEGRQRSNFVYRSFVRREHQPSFGEFTALPRHILPIHNVTINSNNLFANFRWTITFSLRNRMTESTSHLAGLWVGAAISNTSYSHSHKTSSTTAKRAELTGKGSRSTAMLSR